MRQAALSSSQFSAPDLCTFWCARACEDAEILADRGVGTGGIRIPRRSRWFARSVHRGRRGPPFGRRGLGDGAAADALGYGPQLPHGGRPCARDRAGPPPRWRRTRSRPGRAGGAPRQTPPPGVVAAPPGHFAHGMAAPGPGVSPGACRGIAAAARDRAAVCPGRLRRARDDAAAAPGHPPVHPPERGRAVPAAGGRPARGRHPARRHRHVRPAEPASGYDPLPGVPPAPVPHDGEPRRAAGRRPARPLRPRRPAARQPCRSCPRGPLPGRGARTLMGSVSNSGGRS